ncbi:MAG: YciI family protein [Aggregatilineales bacterium]
MKFALLYYYDPTQTSPSEGEVADWMTFDQSVKDAGAFVYEAGFYSDDNAQRVSIREGNTVSENGALVSDGNVQAGLYVIDVSDAATAMKWAERIPTARYGVVEVRSIVEYVPE